MSESVNKKSKLRIGFGRLEANYIATNPLIFKELKLGDMLVCIHKDDYFKMQDEKTELLQHITDLMQRITDLYEIIDPEIIKQLKIKQLKEELSDLEHD
jgi:hypothetical protein